MTDSSSPARHPRPLRKTGHPHALAARARKRREAAAIGITPDYIAAFVAAFYARIRDDALLGPIFARHITDWAHHLDRMNVFWRGVLLNSGEYSGSPMQKHAAIGGLDAAHFARWLDLFQTTLLGLEPQGKASQHVAERARMIAGSLLAGMALHGDGPSGNGGADLQSYPQGY